MQTSLQKPLQKSLQKSLQVIAKVIAKNIAKAGRHDCQHFAHLQANDQSCILPMFQQSMHSAHFQEAFPFTTNIRQLLHFAHFHRRISWKQILVVHCRYVLESAPPYSWKSIPTLKVTCFWWGRATQKWERAEMFLDRVRWEFNAFPFLKVEWNSSWVYVSIQTLKVICLWRYIVQGLTTVIGNAGKTNQGEKSTDFH